MPTERRRINTFVAIIQHETLSHLPVGFLKYTLNVGKTLSIRQRREPVPSDHPIHLFLGLCIHPRMQDHRKEEGQND